MRRRTCSARPGRGRGRPAALPGLGSESGLGRSRLSPSNRPERAAAHFRCKTNPLLATETSSPAVPTMPGRGKRARREAVIGRYPDVLVPGGPPAERLLQGDDLPRRCRFFVDFTTGDFLTWPNNGSEAATYLPAARPLARALRPAAGGRIPRRGGRRQGHGREGLLYVQIALLAKTCSPPP
jgi:hypothetical protein